MNLVYDAPSWFIIFKADFGFDRTDELPLIGGVLLNKIYLTTYLGIIIYVILSVILYKTKFGL